MKIGVLTLFPEMFEAFLSTSIIGRACEAGHLQVLPTNIRPFSQKKHKNTDDYPYGGGAGMVMMVQPIVDCVRHMRSEGFTGKCVYLSPRGKTLTQEKVKALAEEPDLLLLCGHYEGIDQRAIDTVVDEEISIGDYVLTGGELPAMVLIDAVARHIPCVLNEESINEESFSEGLLEYPHYTRPSVWEGMAVPEVLLNGHHQQIIAWRKREALKATQCRRPDLLSSRNKTGNET